MGLLAARPASGDTDVSKGGATTPRLENGLKDWEGLRRH